jgi:hypothetical protein
VHSRWRSRFVTPVNASVSALLRLNRFPLNRCLFVLQGIRDRALIRDAIAIGALTEYAIPRVRDALDLDQRQRALHTTRFPAEARELDQLVDAAMTSLDSYCESQMALFRGHERAAARLERVLLPDGVARITHLPYADQHEQIEALLVRAQAADVIADLAVLSEMALMLARVRELNAEYGAMLRANEDTLTRQGVCARHDECQELLCAVAGLIIGHFALTPERHADRDFLLEPILRENEALRERRRRRRADGNTGDTEDVLPEPDDDTGPAGRAP